MSNVLETDKRALKISYNLLNIAALFPIVWIEAGSFDEIVASSDAVNNVCKRRDLKIRDRNLRVCHAKSDALPSKVKEGPSKRFPHQRQPTAYSGIPSGRGEKRKRIDTDSVSYEGTRSSKTGVPKKSSFRPPQSSVSNSGSRRSGWNEQQGRKTKRPAVAARKAKEHQKRKQSSGTSENAGRNKRARRQ
ncbi:hypothetical protein IEQ34_014286 [Dendrobium chrysotoxum]|uniref:Uncharacterized protein n=1 Tax=Dendrobium chrysotoxum TaxID=161865 RepID=A0AAV7GLJ9_DENCH|nr:hypothetical protein IEQ34_014286 [Dendrobium chrysotoxum]